MLIPIGILRAVLDGCPANYDHDFDCTYKRIKIHSVEVGIVRRRNFDIGSEECSLSLAICSWPIDQSAIMNYCNKRNCSGWTPQVYNAFKNIACSQPHRRLVVKIAYNCNNAHKG